MALRQREANCTEKIGGTMYMSGANFIRGVLTGLLVCVSTQAAALSCIEPNVERQFNEWVDSKDTYYIGVGTLTPTDTLPKIPNALDLNGGFEDKEPIRASYLFSGELLDGEQGHLVELPITVSVSCIGPWCGGFPKAGKSGLMALRGIGLQDLTLDMNACPGSIFPAGTEATVSACIRARRCSVE